MSEYVAQRVSPKRRVTVYVCAVAFGAFLVFLGLLLVTEALIDHDHPSDRGRAFEVVTAASAMTAAAVVSVGLAVAAMFMSRRSYWSPQDNPLPGWGRRARLLARVGIRLFGVSLGTALLLIAPELIGVYTGIVHTSGTVRLVDSVCAVVTGLAMLMMLAGGLVWIPAELVSAVRRRRGRHTDRRL